MNITVELSLPLGVFSLGEMFEKTPISRIELEPVLPLDCDTIPLIRTYGASVDDVAEALRDSRAIAAFTKESALDGEGLFRVEWRHEATEWLRVVVERTGVTLLRGSATEDGWLLRVRAEEDDVLRAFQRDCRAEGVDVELRRVVDHHEGNSSRRYGVTLEQREALLLAATEGYFEEPRETKLEELADQLGISRQAFAGRLRRGHRNLIRDTLDAP